MKISHYALQLGSRHQHLETQHQQLRIEIIPPPQAVPPQEVVTLSDSGTHATEPDAGHDADAAGLTPQLMLLKGLLERLFGASIKLLPANALQAPEPVAIASPPAPGGVIVTASTSYREQETLQVSGNGSVSTADGQRFEFMLDISSSRSFRLDANLTARSGAAAKDPLLLTLDGHAAQFAGATVQFQLDAQRPASALPMPSNGGWLALDRNRNGKVDNGGELFGPASGDGFADLAQLDRNQDGVLDDSDPLFAELKLWQARPDGQAQLAALSSVRVGAILLQRVAAPFSYRDGQNQEFARARSAGLYLSEDGQAGYLGQVDVSV